MKKLVLLLFAVTLSILSFAQNQLWGMTWRGGQYGSGTIIKTNGTGSGESVAHEFSAENEGFSPYHSKVIEASNGKLYGVIQNGGIYHVGVLFEYNPVDSSFTKRFDFGGLSGANPRGSLMQANDGMLYGMAWSGGLNDLGTLFRFDPNTFVFTKLIDFSGFANGSHPYGSLMQASDGKIYGMTSEGGTQGNGTLFQYTIATNTLVKKVDFTVSTGTIPRGSLIQATDGMLYGLTSQGGLNSVGIVFRYNSASNVFTTLASFNSATQGANPNGDLLQASDGNLWGLCQSGGANGSGSVFSFNITTLSLILAYSFSSAADGGSPLGTLIQATNGKLYGLTSNGGANNKGTIFQFDITTLAFMKKADFNGVGFGANPYGSLMQASNGKMYALTNQGGTRGNGVYFEFNPSNDSITKRADLGIVDLGENPMGTLTYHSNGNLYGMTSQGGVNGMGILFSFDPVYNTFMKLVDFNGTANGASPQGTLTVAPNGKLYGLTKLGGVNNYGTLFEYDPATSVFTKKVDFSGTANGAYPYASLALASNGKLYGTTYGGGTAGVGVLFEYNPTTSVFTKKKDFNTPGTTGLHPQGNLIQGINGKLYGETPEGGTYFGGVLFEYDITANSYTVVHHFASSSGPKGTLVQTPDGKLYGLTPGAGAYGFGTLFCFDPATTNFSNLVNFGLSSTGGIPSEKLLLGSNGNLYGFAGSTGNYNGGVLFEYDLVNMVYSIQTNFTGLNGYIPSEGLIELPVQLVTGTLASSTFCPGDTIAIPFIITDSAAVGNIFFAELSDASGSFANPDTIGTLAGRVSDTIIAVIPRFATNGTGYRIRVVASLPSITGTINAVNLTINGSSAPAVSYTSSPLSGTVCAGQQVTLTASGNATSYSWSGGIIDGVAFTPSASGSYTLTGTSVGVCNGYAVASITVNPLPQIAVTTSPASAVVCAGDSMTLTASGATTYSWTGGVINNTAFVPASSGTYTVTGTDSNGCTDTLSQSVTVNALPNVSLNLPMDSLCVNDGVTTLSGEFPLGGSWSGNGVSGNSLDPAVASVGNDPVIYFYTDTNGCSSSDTSVIWIDICMSTVESSGENNFQVYPNPGNGDIAIHIQNSSEENFTLCISDAQGKIIWTNSFAGQDMIIQPEVHIEAAGFYLLRYRSDSEEKTIRVIVE